MENDPLIVSVEHVKVSSFVMSVVVFGLVVLNEKYIGMLSQRAISPTRANVYEKFCLRALSRLYSLLFRWTKLNIGMAPYSNESFEAIRKSRFMAPLAVDMS